MRRCTPRSVRSAAFGLVLSAVLPFFAVAQSEAATTRIGPVEAELLVRDLSLAPGRPFLAGVLLKVDADWHVYWRNPGDSGLPTTVEWDLPPGFTAGPLQFPYPERFDTDGLVTFGHSGEVLLLAEITPPKTLAAGTTAVLRARVTWLACSVECLPGEADLEKTVAVTQGAPVPDQRLAAGFAAAQARLPVVDPSLELGGEMRAGRVVLSAKGLGSAGVSSSVFFPEAESPIAASARQVWNLDDDTLRLEIDANAFSKESPDRMKGVLVISAAGGTRGIVVDLPVVASGGQAAASVPSVSSIGILLAIVLAFAGGILLNLMPCVLPVLSLKVISLVCHAGDGRKASLAHGLLYAAGVLVSFWLIAGVLVALRAGGSLLGWGFQFQNPAVVVVVAVAFFLLSLNLLGVYEVGAGLAGAAASSQACTDVQEQGRAGWLRSFGSGLFATAVATPCSAPFMGAALGYAVAQPAGISFGVFTALGLGMALPFVLLSALPGLASRLPKPGRWMETLKNLMGFPLIATVVWLASLLGAQAGGRAVTVLLAGLAAAGTGAWVWGRWGGLDRSRKSRLAAASVALLLVLGGIAVAIVGVRGGVPPAAGEFVAAGEPRSLWEPWTPQRVRELRSQGRPVFVDFSAKWCLTCTINEATTLSSRRVVDRFQELGVALLKADWTDRDDSIAQALAGLGRAGVPVYALYATGAPEPVLLPEILTPGIVLDALDRLR